jgi:membrane-associated protein
MHQLFDIPNLIITYGYLGILVIVFLESGIFFPLPGDSLLFTAGLLAPVLGYNVFFLTLLVFLSAFFGGIVGYFIGSKLDYFYRFSFFRKIIKQKYLDDGHVFLAKHGLFAMLLSRFIPVVRTFLPIVAGMVHMKYEDFIRYSLLGSFLWSSIFVLGGYYLGKSFPQILEYLLLVIIIIVILSILPGVYHYLKRRTT